MPAEPRLKPPSPLRVRNGRFGAFFGRRGDAGFKAPLLGVSSGVGGFNAAILSRLVREKVRPAALCHRESAKKFALRAHNGPKLAFLGVLGEFFRANRCCAGLGCSAVHFRLASSVPHSGVTVGGRPV